MKLEVIGAGFGRTGTKSLKDALELLGFDRCYHMFEVFQEHPEHIADWKKIDKGEAVDWDLLFTEYQSAVDWPSAKYWRELSEIYPDAKVILTMREPEKWYESVMNTIYPKTLEMMSGKDEQVKLAGEWIHDIIWQGIFSGRIEDKQYAISIYQSHKQEVIDTIPAERLLVMEQNYDWQPLCDFLGCAIPDEPYPHTNTRTQFNEPH